MTRMTRKTWTSWLRAFSAPSMTRIAALALCFVGIAGCRTMAGPQEIPGLTPPGGIQQAGATQEDSEDRVVQASDEVPSLTDRTKKASNQVMNFLSGREQENMDRAKELYRQGDQLFKQASGEPNEERVKTFAKAAKLFSRAGEAAPGTALQQDAMFMEGESLFFADRLVDASEVYEQLQKDFPRNRHIDRVAARLFSISRYWAQTAEADKGKWLPINLTDPKKPRLDADGHAVRVLDQIRYDDPTGRLADDATMAAAAEYIRQERFEEADEFLTDLRETFPDSEHLFLAHLIGINVKLEVYRGPKYSGLVLEEAEKLVQRTKERFPDKLAEKDYADRLARAAAEIAFLQAERLRYRANYREKRREFAAARYYYNLLLQRYPDTPHADTARERLAATEEYPARPPQRLSWLTTIFPDSTSNSPPLEMTKPDEGDQPQTMLR